VVHSLSNVDFWRTRGGIDTPWWEGGLPDDYIEQWNASNRDPGVLAAVQWKNIIEIARREKSLLQENQYMEIRYEGFMDSPHTVLSNIYAMVGLKDSKRAHDYLDKRSRLRNMNFKYKTDMSVESIKLISDAMQPLLRELGYV
jgi:hypothetical protein